MSFHFCHVQTNVPGLPNVWLNVPSGQLDDFILNLQNIQLDNFISNLQSAFMIESDEETNGIPTEIIDLLPEKIAKDNKECCPICLENFNEKEILTTLPCYHTFHKVCIKAWLEKNSNCPVCRVKLNF